MTQGNLIVLAGPSAVGKSTVVAELKKTVPNLYFSVSMTTRDPRPGEVDGQDYFFVTKDEFEQKIEDKQMLEWAEIHGGLQLSGTPSAPVFEALDDNRPVLVEVDLEGARNIKQLLPEAKTVFLAPPSWEVLVSRLVGRNTESADVIEKRLATAKNELAAQEEFDYTVVNNSVDQSVQEISSILTE